MTRRAPPLLAACLLVLTGLAGLTLPRGAVGAGALAAPGAGLRVGMDPSFDPFEFHPGPGTAPIGYDVDLAAALAARLGRPLVLVPTAYDALADGLRTGRLDAVISAFPHDPRLTQDLRFTGAYFNAGPILVTRGGQPLDGPPRRVAVELGSAADAAARRLRPTPDAIVRLSSVEAVVGALLAGQADAALLDVVTALRADPGIAPVGTPVEDELYVVAVRADNTALFTELNIALEALRREGYLDTLAVRWMGRALRAP